MVCATVYPSLRAASCCKVEVVNGAAGLFFTGRVTMSSMVKDAFLQLSRNAFASSFVFNSSIFDNTLRSAGIPQPEGPKTAVATFATVDKRDGFSWAALECDYLIVADPIQYHLGEQNQHLVTVLAQPVLEGTGIGTAYRRLGGSFPLQDGVTVYVYERTRDIAPEEYQAISAELTALYPEYAAQYHSPV